MTVPQFAYWTVGRAVIVAVLACAAVGRSETKAAGEVCPGHRALHHYVHRPEQ